MTFAIGNLFLVGFLCWFGVRFKDGFSLGLAVLGLALSAYIIISEVF